MQTEHKSVIGVILLVIIFVISIPFEKRYVTALSQLANNPAARLFAGVGTLYLAHQDIVLGALGFIILFLWMSDIQLLSSLKF